MLICGGASAPGARSWTAARRGRSIFASFPQGPAGLRHRPFSAVATANSVNGYNWQISWSTEKPHHHERSCHRPREGKGYRRRVIPADHFGRCIQCPLFVTIPWYFCDTDHTMPWPKHKMHQKEARLPDQLSSGKIHHILRIKAIITSKETAQNLPMDGKLIVWFVVLETWDIYATFDVSKYLCFETWYHNNKWLLVGPLLGTCPYTICNSASLLDPPNGFGWIQIKPIVVIKLYVFNKITDTRK